MLKPYYQDEWVKQYCADAQKVLGELPDESIDLLATDPPYGLSSITKRFGKDGAAPAKYGTDGRYTRLSSGFMGKKWDVLPDIEIWQECLRVLKCGAFAFVMCIPRQDSLAPMILRLQEAGFDVGYTPIFWAYASGFPKAQNIGKVVDKRLGAKRKRVTTTHTDMFGDYQRASQHMSGIGKAFGDEEWESGSEMVESTIPASPQAKALDGSYGGFQPKPAVEIIVVAMKPLSEKTFVDQALKTQKGISWLDDCRIPYKSEQDREGSRWGSTTDNPFGVVPLEHNRIASQQGRFPANLLVSDDVLDDGVVRESGEYKGEGSKSGGFWQKSTGQPAGREYGDSGSFSRYFDLDKWWAKTFPFFIVPKASKSEKDRYLDTVKSPYEKSRKDGWQSVLHNNPDGSVKTYKNYHPTVKPLKLMSYLITLGSRAGDTVLDPFLGSGTTALASKLLNRKCIGIEIEEKYCEIAANRCRQMVFDFGNIPQRDGAAEAEFYQFLLDNKDNPEFMKDVKL